ncbi:hypothetical protein J2T08_002617 [Neorhizobium galegae]|nr:hypothetical protein [Neorhizobium galegae]
MIGGCETGSFDLKGQPELKQALKTCVVGKIALFNANRLPVLKIGGERSDTLPGLDQTLIAKLRDRFAHDRPADAEGLCQNVFRRQLLARRDPALADLASDLRRDPRGQMFVSSDLAEVHYHGAGSPL